MFELHAPVQEAGLALWPVLVVVAFMVAINVVNNRIAPQTHFLLWAFGSSVVLIAIGLLDGNSWTDMGLSWRFGLSGLFWAGLTIALVTIAYAIASSFKKTRQAFHDERYAQMSGGRLVFQTLLEVPFGTVLMEEIAFRAVLFSMLARRYGVIWGLVISSVLFGLWHILPSIGTHESNPALGGVAGEGRKGNVIAVALSVLTTSVAGVIFVGLRLVSGSILGPMGLHWATNGLGYFFSFFLIRIRDRAAAGIEDLVHHHEEKKPDQGDPDTRLGESSRGE
jgi:membrane protease YdiL (CAAX protease family)